MTGHLSQTWPYPHFNAAFARTDIKDIVLSPRPIRSGRLSVYNTKLIVVAEAVTYRSLDSIRDSLILTKRFRRDFPIFSQSVIQSPGCKCFGGASGRVGEFPEPYSITDVVQINPDEIYSTRQVCGGGDHLLEVRRSRWQNFAVGVERRAGDVVPFAIEYVRGMGDETRTVHFDVTRHAVVAKEFVVVRCAAVRAGLE